MKKHWYLLLLVGEGVGYSQNKEMYLGHDAKKVTIKDIENAKKKTDLFKPIAFSVSYLGYMTQEELKGE